MESARRATPLDRGGLIAMATAAIEELAPTRGGSVWARREARPLPVDGSIDRDLADPAAAVFVGTVDDVPLGYAVVRSETLRDGSLLGVLDDLYVDEGARGVGVGEAMMGLVIEWCEELGCIGVDSIALPGNRATKNFFETFGLTARAIVVHRSLGASAEEDRGV